MIICLDFKKYKQICLYSNYESSIEKYKGIRSGIILKRLLKKEAITQRPFALSFGEHPETLNAITKGKRRLNIALALKIEEKSSLEKGSLALLQTYFEIKDEKSKAKYPSSDSFKKIFILGYRYL